MVSTVLEVVAREAVAATLAAAADSAAVVADSVVEVVAAVVGPPVAATPMVAPLPDCSQACGTPWGGGHGAGVVRLVGSSS